MPELVVIAALAEHSRVIGRGLDLPWHLPEDLKRFKALTIGHPVVMGRRTFDAVLHQLGRPLPGRENVVLTRSRSADLPDRVRVFGSLPEAVAAYADRETVFIGGGASVYRQVLSGETLADRLELTLVEADPEGDAFFPPWEHLVGDVYEMSRSERHEPAGGRPGFRFETYVRRPQP